MEKRHNKLINEAPDLSLIEYSEDFAENIRSLLHDKLKGTSMDGRMTWATTVDDKTLEDIVRGIWFYVGKEAVKYPEKELRVKTSLLTIDDLERLDALLYAVRNNKTMAFTFQKMPDEKYEEVLKRFKGQKK